MKDCPRCGKHLLDCSGFAEYYCINRGCGFRTSSLDFDGRLVTVSVYYNGKNYSSFVKVIPDADGRSRISTNDILRAVGLKDRIQRGENYMIR